MPPRWHDTFAAGSAAFVYGLLADAAAETFWSGSPVRWWVVAAVAIYALATVLLWRRTTWRARAAASFFVLLGTLAVTAWLPSGFSDGVRLVGRPSAALFSLTTAGGVALAGLVLWHAPSVPRWARWGIVTLAAYGVIAFVYGFVAGAPFPVLLAGASLPLPWVLQGTFIGGLVVLPVALVASVVRAGIRLREGSPRHELYRVVALAMSLAIVLAALPERATTPSGSPVGTRTTGLWPPGPIVPSSVLTASLENSVRAIEDGERESPRDLWDPQYIVDQVGRDHAALFAWVHDNTFWVPYRGLLRGPVGVLMDSLGNSLDRAVLLATLLQQAGYPVRLAHGELSREQALDILPSLILSRLSESPPESDDTDPEFQAVAAQYQLDGAALQRTFGSEAESMSRVISDLEIRVADQTERLGAVLGKRAVGPDWSDRLDAAVQALRDHWWVQRQDGSTWLDLDLLAPDASPGERLATARETIELKDASGSLSHEIVVRVVAERWARGAIAERTVLEHSLRPADLIGQPVVLQFWPTSWPADFPPFGAEPKQGLRATALEQHKWEASLLVGSSVAARSVLTEDGDIDDDRTASGPMGGLGNAMAHAFRNPRSEQSNKPVNVLTAAWIEYDIHVPGEPPRTIRREVFDLVGPAARGSKRVPRVSLNDADRLTRSLSLMMRTEILPVTCRIAPEFVTHLVARGMLANRELLGSAVRGELSDESNTLTELAERSAPMPSPLYSLAVARFDLSRWQDQLYVDRLGILTRHIFLASTGDHIAMRDDSDVVANEIGVDLGAPDAFVVRLEQGVLDTNAEGLVHATGRVIGGTARAFAASRDWVKLTSSQDSALGSLTLADDARRRIVEDLAAGYVVVAPKAPVPLEAGAFVGWWRIDPATGHALGVASNGWGQDMAERSLLDSTAYKMSKQFAFDYLLCQSITQVANQARPLVNRFFTPSWVKKITKAEDARALWHANHKMCLVGAIVSGAAFATLPLLLLSLRLRYLAKVANALKRINGPRRRPVPRPAPPTPRPAKPSTGPALAKTDPGVPPTQRSPQAAKLDPCGKTEPDLSKTQLDPQKPSELGATQPNLKPPRSNPPTWDEVMQAAEKSKALLNESREATRELVQYSVYRPRPEKGWVGDPSKWDPAVFEALQNEFWLKNLRAEQAIDAHQALRKAYMNASCGDPGFSFAEMGSTSSPPSSQPPVGRGSWNGWSPSSGPPPPASKTPGSDPLGKTLPDCPPNCLYGPIKKHPTLFTAKTQPDLSKLVPGPQTMPGIGGPGQKTLVGIGGVLKTLGGGQ